MVSPKLAAADAWLDSRAYNGSKLEERLDMCANWYTVVEIYSVCALPFERDRLPALAGLAEQAQRSRRGRYLAGLWDDSLLSDLDWYRSKWANTGNVEANARNSDSSSPTWSWASVDGGLGFGQMVTGNPSMPLCDILEIDYTPLNPFNPRGQVSHAKLVIRGHVVQGVWVDGNIDLPIIKEYCHFDYDVPLQGPAHVEEGSALFCLIVGALSLLFCVDLETYRRGIASV